MKKVVAGVVITLAMVFIFRSGYDASKKQSILEENTMLIQEQIRNVSKLVVSEGHFAEVYNFKDSQQLFGDFLTANKKALVVVNAEVSVAYDLSLIDFEVAESTKTLHIKSLPEPEIKINPDFEYYDITADYLNPFEAKDYNTIKKHVNASLMKKVASSSLKGNAHNRLISELQKFYILTNSMGWTLTYNDEIVRKNFSEFLGAD